MVTARSLRRKEKRAYYSRTFSSRIKSPPSPPSSFSKEAACQWLNHCSDDDVSRRAQGASLCVRRQLCFVAGDDGSSCRVTSRAVPPFRKEEEEKNPAHPREKTEQPTKYIRRPRPRIASFRKMQVGTFYFLLYCINFAYRFLRFSRPRAKSEKRKIARKAFRSLEFFFLFG